MKNKAFGTGAWLCSLAGAAVGAFAATPEYWNLETAEERMIWGGLFFLAVFLGGFVGLSIYFAASKRWQIVRSGNWALALILAGALIFGVGAGGQALFMRSHEVVTRPSEVDMVLLLDASGSMDFNHYSAPRTDAASQFVDSLNEDCRLQVVSFAAIVLDSSPLLTVDDQGKSQLKDFISRIDSTGETDFNAPLTVALSTLETQGRADSSKAIVLLTDGEGDLDPQVASDCIASGVQIFSLRITSETMLSREARALVDLAEQSGGFDTRLAPTNGTVDTAAMLDAFQQAFQATTERRDLMLEQLLVFSEEPASMYQLAVRAASLIVLSVLFGVGYYGRLDKSRLLWNILCGAAAAVLVTVCGELNFYASAICICLGLGSAFVTLEWQWQGGEVIDV